MDTEETKSPVEDVSEDISDSRSLKKPSIQASLSRFNENNNQENDLKDGEYIRRRKKRRDGNIRIRSHRKIKLFQRIYIPAVAFIAGGVVATLACSVKTIGGGTFFWNFKEVFRIVGPIVLASGLILLLIAVGLINEESLRLKSEDTKDEEREMAAEIGKKLPEHCRCNCAENRSRNMELRGLYHGNDISRDGTILHSPLSKESLQFSNCSLSEVQRHNTTERTKQVPSIHIHKEKPRRCKLELEGSSECETFESSFPSASTEMTSSCSPNRSLNFDFSGQKNASRQNNSENSQHNATSFTNDPTCTTNFKS